MKIILFIIVILIIGIIYFYIKNKKENFEVKGNKQPRANQEIYDYNLEQALQIWHDAGCSDGKYKPNRRNKRIWAHENWRKEVESYVKEAKKFEKEHNWYDYVPGRGNTVYIKRRDVTRTKISPIGIREAWRRCFGDDLGPYKFPKTGDIVRLKRNDNSASSEYYKGVVLRTAIETGTKKHITQVMWTHKGRPGGGKDKKRFKTRGFPSIVSDSRVVKTGKEFGWPLWRWSRGDKQRDYLTPSSWLKNTYGGMIINKYGGYASKRLYKVSECKKKGTTGCDYLRCDKRKEAVLNDYPLTYNCSGDPRNRHKGVWMCGSGSKKGKFYSYYNKNTMCKDDYKRGKPDTFCVQDCGGRCIKTTVSKELKRQMARGTKCGLLASDNRWSIRNGNFALLDNSTAYIPKIKGFYNGKCYRDRPRRALPYFMGRIKNTKRCIKVAGERGFPYAGLQYGGECWGGWNPNKYGSASNCNMRRGRQKMGGAWAQNVYRTKIGKYIPSSIFKNGVVKSLKIFGRDCKFGKRNIGGLYRNLNLKGFNTSCAYNQSKYNLAFESTRRNGILFQDLERCQRAFGKCRSKIINTGWRGRDGQGCNMRNWQFLYTGRGGIKSNRVWTKWDNFREARGSAVNKALIKYGAPTNNRGKVTRKGIQKWINKSKYNRRPSIRDVIYLIKGKIPNRRWRDWRYRKSFGYNWGRKYGSGRYERSDPNINNRFIAAH